VARVQILFSVALLRQAVAVVRRVVVLTELARQVVQAAVVRLRSITTQVHRERLLRLVKVVLAVRLVDTIRIMLQAAAVAVLERLAALRHLETVARAARAELHQSTEPQQLEQAAAVAVFKTLHRE